MNKVLLSLQHIDKYYGDFKALKDFSLDVYEGEFLTLLGPSGCGKTTVLRSIAGFEEISKGDIVLLGHSIVNDEPNKRSVNTVFQNYALFPHLNVYENIIYGPRIQNSIPKDEREERVKEVLKLVQMEGYENRGVDQMSGGQKQRIAIARALINNPSVVFADEPSGNLDSENAQQLHQLFLQLRAEFQQTFVMVTHNKELADLADRKLTMKDGKIIS